MDLTDALLSLIDGDAERCAECCRRASIPASMPLEASFLECLCIAVEGGDLDALPGHVSVVRAEDPNGLSLATLLGACLLTAMARDRADLAARFLDEVTQVHARLDQPFGLGVAAFLAGEHARWTGDLEDACDHYARAADLLGARGTRPDIGAVLAKHGEPLLLLGRDQEAEPLLVEALARQWALAIPRVQSDTLAALAILHAHNGRPRSAVALLGASAALAGPAHPLAIGGRPLPSADLHAATREALAPDDWQRAWDDGFRQPTRQIRRVISGAS